MDHVTWATPISGMIILSSVS